MTCQTLFVSDVRAAASTTIPFGSGHSVEVVFEVQLSRTTATWNAGSARSMPTSSLGVSSATDAAEAPAVASRRSIAALYLPVRERAGGQAVGEAKFGVRVESARHVARRAVRSALSIGGRRACRVAKRGVAASASRARRWRAGCARAGASPTSGSRASAALWSHRRRRPRAAAA